jgi:hypothetical protein
MNEKLERGRPKKTLKDFPNNWELSIMEMAREGCFDMDYKVFLDISNNTFDRMLEEEPYFLETITKARQVSETFWTSIARVGFKQGNSKNINAQLLNLVLRNAFKHNWNEAQTKVDITTNGKEIDSNKKIEIEIVKKIIDEKE